MLPTVMFIVSVVAAYLIGSFPTSFILAKFIKGVDIRQVGSGNAGATNVLRVAGKVPAIITLIVDLLKGVFVATLVAKFFYSFGIDLVYEFYQPFLGLVAVCGHIWSVFLRFKGGKGVATTLGVAIAIAPSALLPSLILWIVVFLLMSYVSLASIIALLAFPLFSALLNQSIYTTIIGAIICLISIFKHRTNIGRLLKGEENKTVLFKQNVKI